MRNHKFNGKCLCGRIRFEAEGEPLWVAHCGTPLSYESERCPGEIHFYISVMDTPDVFKPQRHVFHEEHISWLEQNDDLPRYEGIDRDEPSSWGPKRSSVN